MFTNDDFIGKSSDIIEITSGRATNLLLERSGIDNLKVSLPLQFDIGTLKELDEYKRYEFKKIIKKDDINYDFSETFNKLKQYVSKSKKIRVWTSLFDADEYTMLLFICHNFKDKEISIILSNGVSYNATTIAQNSEDEIKELVKREIVLKDYQKEWFDKEWVDLTKSNSELRFMINGHLVSKDINYFDCYILDRLKSLGKTTKVKLIASLMGNPVIPGIFYADIIYNYLIDKLIEKKLIIKKINTNEEIIEVKT